MVLEPGRSYAVVDTSVLSYFTARSPRGRRYRELLGDRTIALSYFVRTELDGRDWSVRRRALLNALYEECVGLPAAEATGTWYNRANAKRRELGLISQVSDTDLWIIAHAAEYGVPYMSHDRGACAVARALGVEVLTALQGD